MSDTNQPNANSSSEAASNEPAGISNSAVNSKVQRIDAPHGIRSATAKTPAMTQAQSSAPAAINTTATDNDQNSASESVALPLDAANPIEGQAGQLAEWLQQQHRDIETRIAAITTQEADLAEKLSTAKQWHEEQQQQLDEREAALDLAGKPAAGPTAEQLEAVNERNSELDARQAHLDNQTERLAIERANFAGRQSALDARQTKIVQTEEELLEGQEQASESVRATQRAATEHDLREQELRQLTEKLRNDAADVEERERRLVLRQQEIDSAIDRYERLDVAERRVADLQEELADHAKREQFLSESESLLADERIDHAKERERFEKESQALRLKLNQESGTFEQDQAAWQAEHKEMLNHSERREAEIDRREVAIERMQVELQTTQREVLEMRLATEETWAQLTGLLAPAALTRSISKVRVQLSDHYSHALQQLSDSRGALREASAQVTTEYTLLEQRRTAIEEWSNRRHESLGEAAGRLEGREKELDRQQRQYEQYEARWAAERESYREQIRTLLTELRDTEPTIRLAKAA